MISFLNFINESKRSDERQLRKEIDGHKPPVEDPDLEVVHHDKDRGTTIYRMKNDQACQKAGSPKWCTTPKDSFHRQRYLNNGDLYVVHAKKQAHQVFIPKAGSYSNPEMKNWENGRVDITRLRLDHPGVANIPGFRDHFGTIGKYDHEKFTSENMVRHIKSIEDPGERLRHLKGAFSDQAESEYGFDDRKKYANDMARKFFGGTKTLESKPENKSYLQKRTGVKVSVLASKMKDKDYQSVGLHLNASHLHHFADDSDPAIRHHVASHAYPEHIPLELTQDSDPHVRQTALRRTSGMTPRPMERQPEPKDKAQKSFRLLVPKRN